MEANPTWLAHESASTPRQSPTNPPHRILVVEDEPSIRQLNTQELLRSGYAVDAAEDGAAAWEAFSSGESYDLLITDHNMPRLTGVDLLKKLRGARMALPVILATGALPGGEFIRHPWLQPAAVLLKPYTIAELLGMVKKVLRATGGTRLPSEISLAAGSSASALPVSRGEEIAPPSNEQSRRSAERLQL